MFIIPALIRNLFQVKSVVEFTMRSAIVLLNVLLVFNLINNICADFSIPDVVLIAYKPRGFVAYIPGKII